MSVNVSANLPAGNTAKKKNILLITADQWRGDCLSAASHPLVQTPHLDALAKRGVRFERHYAGAAPCSPARACLYTGLYQMNNRVCMNGSPLDSRHDTLALAFRRLGYDPTLFGYTDQSADPRDLASQDPRLTTYEGLLPGFRWRVGLSEEQLTWLSWLQRQGYPNAMDIASPDIHMPDGKPDDPPTGRAPIYSAQHTETAFLVDEFERWLSEQKSARAQVAQGMSIGGHTPAWFAHVSFLRPHPPFSVPAPYNTMFSANDIGVFAGSGDVVSEAAVHPLLEYLFERVSKSGFIPGAEGLVRDWGENDLKAIAAIYYGMVAEVDAQIGVILKALESNGFLDDTIIVFTSDHGEQLGDHCMLGKYGFYDQSFHVPLIISDPSRTISHGQSIANFTEAVDIMPTMIDLAGGIVPDHLDGRSLAPALHNGKLENWRQSAHWEYDFRDVCSNSAEQYFGLPSQLCNLSVLRGERYKYVHCAGLPPVLFDLQKHPDESVNVVDDPAYTAVRIDCCEELLSWRAQHLDQSLALSKLSPNGEKR